MTLQEKTFKTTTAQRDLNTLNSLLDRNYLNDAGSTISKIMSTLDYKDFIKASRALHKIPFGTTPFGSLKYEQQRKIVNMLIDAVTAYLSVLKDKQTDNQDKKTNLEQKWKAKEFADIGK